MGKAPLSWQSGYINPNMPPAVIRALADAGFAPDGTRLPEPTIGSAFDGLSTQDRLAALDDRISQDWQGMGFDPPEPPVMPELQDGDNEENIFIGATSGFADTGPDPFGAETRQRVDDINRRIDGDMMRMAEPPLPVPQQAPAMPQRGPIGGMSYTPPLPAPMPRPPVPKPTPRPQPSSYTIKAGDNPTKIARMFGMTLGELEKKNPGILKNARRLKPGAAVKI
jgi:hypothetical protein